VFLSGSVFCASVEEVGVGTICGSDGLSALGTSFS
jgi:hypothetical protein